MVTAHKHTTRSASRRIANAAYSQTSESLESSSSSQTAALQVLNTAELLEAILLFVFDKPKSPPTYGCAQVNMRTVLLSQRVNQFFNNTINGSAELLRALWMAPGGETPDQVFNPLLELDGLPIVTPKHPYVLHPYVLHPYVFVRNLGLNALSVRMVNFHVEKNKAYPKDNESWRRMLIAQGYEREYDCCWVDKGKKDVKFNIRARGLKRKVVAKLLDEDAKSVRLGMLRELYSLQNA